MTRNQPTLLFTLAGFHTYFENGLCAILQFQPGNITRSLQQRFGFPLRNSKNGFGFYQSSSAATQDYLHYITTTTGYDQFEFTLHTISDFFYTITDFPPGWNGQIQYDSANVVISGEQKMILQPHLSTNQTTTVAGILNIRFQDIISGLQKGVPPQYEFHFRTRTTQWQYYVVNDSNVVMTNPTINNDQGIVFDGPNPVTIPSGLPALCFSSGNQLLALEERPSYRFSLVGNSTNGSGRNKVIVKRLPCAEPEAYGIAQIGNQTQYTSPIYVFI
ncbi:MAG: hypothetical protein NTW29_16960 [Bacteroidetes bacterium]|nr:hypothetical protein [Bacteroidota bacterium]